MYRAMWTATWPWVHMFSLTWTAWNTRWYFLPASGSSCWHLKWTMFTCFFTIPQLTHARAWKVCLLFKQLFADCCTSMLHFRHVQLSKRFQINKVTTLMSVTLNVQILFECWHILNMYSVPWSSSLYSGVCARRYPAGNLFCSCTDRQNDGCTHHGDTRSIYLDQIHSEGKTVGFVKKYHTAWHLFLFRCAWYHWESWQVTSICERWKMWQWWFSGNQRLQTCGKDTTWFKFRYTCVWLSLLSRSLADPRPVAWRKLKLSLNADQVFWTALSTSCANSAMVSMTVNFS